MFEISSFVPEEMGAGARGQARMVEEANTVEERDGDVEQEEVRDVVVEPENRASDEMLQEEGGSERDHEGHESNGEEEEESVGRDEKGSGDDLATNVFFIAEEVGSVGPLSVNVIDDLDIPQVAPLPLLPFGFLLYLSQRGSTLFFFRMALSLNAKSPLTDLQLVQNSPTQTDLVGDGWRRHGDTIVPVGGAAGVFSDERANDVCVGRVDCVERGRL